MPSLSSRLSQLLGFRHSRSRPPNPTPATVHPHSPGTSCTPSSCSLHGQGVPQQDAKAVAGTQCPPAAGNPVGHEDTTEHVFADGATSDFGGQLPQTLRALTPVGVVDSNSDGPQSLVAQPASHLSSTGSIPSPRSLPPEHSLHALAPSQRNQGMFHQSHDFAATGNFIEGNVGNVVYMSTPSNQFMKDLLKETIPGAAFDSSARDPPPRCHPGTRLAVLRRCIDFISNCDSGKRMRWVVGGTGVGKSAIMQNVAESPKLPGTSNASIFFSNNGRNDGNKAIKTLSYQFAAKSEAYRRVVEDEVNRDPSILHSSMAVQFDKFIVQPFINNASLNTANRVLIIIDGLDECDNPRTQIELLRLISNLCLSYPSSPIVWLIASRPETHITSFFSRAEVVPVFEKEEILVDSNDARADVERFLRDTLAEIRKASDSLDSQWPDEQDLWKLANAAGGLFAYADTAMKYIGDSTIGSPASQLSDVLHAIDNHPMIGVSREEHPMALLDALYARILSKVPSKIMINTRKFLLTLALDLTSFSPGNFVVLCNWLNMTPDDAYAALNHLRSVLRVPRRDKSDQERLVPCHKSFVDYISDFSRSGFSSDILREARQLQAQCAFRILKEASDGIDFGEVYYRTPVGTLLRGPGSGDEITLTWPADEESHLNDDEMRLSMYKLAMGEVIAGIKCGDPTFQSVFYIQLLTTKFEKYDRIFFPHNELCRLVFGESRRHENMMNGILKQIPLRTIKIHTIFGGVGLQFRRPTTTMTNVSDSWNASCQHEREKEEENSLNWGTTFWRNDCAFCYSRLEHQLGSWKVQTSDCTVPVLFTSAGECCVEFLFVDVEDGMSEWIYRFWCKLTPEE